MQNNENINGSLNSFPLGQEDMETRLWAYIDGVSEETSKIEELMAENRQWREKYAELLEVHQCWEDGSCLERPRLHQVR